MGALDDFKKKLDLIEELSKVEITPTMAFNMINQIIVLKHNNLALAKMVVEGVPHKPESYAKRVGFNREEWK